MLELQGTDDFASLSLKDLLEARDLYHFHLLNKANVVGTAVGKYLMRKKAGNEKVNRVRIPLHPIRRSGRIRSLVPKDPIRDRSGATSGMMIRLRVWDLAGA